MKMDRYACNGHLYVTADKHVCQTLRVRITHHRWHHPYTDISISEEVETIIQEMKDLPAAKVCPSYFLFIVMLIYFVMVQIWERILRENPQIELTEKQVYASWAHLNEDSWRLNNEQVKSAQKVLENHNGDAIEIIPVHAEDGISVIAFGFKEIVDDYGKEITEIAMDSTCSFSLLAHQTS
jgi:hypothetical protein